MLTTVTWILVLLWKSEQIMPHSILKQPDLTALDLKESHVDLQTAKVSLENMTLIIKSTDDQMMTAKLVEEDKCIFTGYMVGCPESTVVVTGCAGEAQSVQIQSDMFGDMAFTTEDGIVKSVVLNNQLKRNKRNTGDIDYNEYYDTLENPEFEALYEEYENYEFEEVEPPEKFRLGVNIYLDTALSKRNLNRENALNILRHTQTFWQHRSLSTKLDIRFDSARIFLSRKHLLIKASSYNTKVLSELVGPSKVDAYPTAHIYLTTKEPGETKRSALGLGKVESMCAANHGKPRVMVRYKENDLRTALTVAHELGHLLGMYHDFEKPSERLHKCGKGKFKGETVMNYGNNRTVWSECSQDDFKLYYNKVLLKNDDKFCLQEVSEAADSIVTTTTRSTTSPTSPTTKTTGNGCLKEGISLVWHNGQSIEEDWDSSKELCEEKCKQNSICIAWTWNNRWCALKGENQIKETENKGYWSGFKSC